MYTIQKLTCQDNKSCGSEQHLLGKTKAFQVIYSYVNIYAAMFNMKLNNYVGCYSVIEKIVQNLHKCIYTAC